jgi:hypothetical protein
MSRHSTPSMVVLTVAAALAFPVCAARADKAAAPVFPRTLECAQHPPTAVRPQTGEVIHPVANP